MLAVLEQWGSGPVCHANNTVMYLLLMIFKLGMDAAVFYLCCRKPYTSFSSMCSLSIVLSDLVTTCLMATVWILGEERSPVSPCMIVGNASMIYGALPLPMMSLCLLDYCLEDTLLGNKSILKFLRNAALTSLVWTLAVVYSFGPHKAELIDVSYGTTIMALVCEVEESAVIIYFVVVLFTAVICTMVPFWSMIPPWVKEADRLSQAREEQENQKGNLFTSTSRMETKKGEEDYLEETVLPRPPLWFSLSLGFGMIWMPYLTVSVACLVLGIGVPAYITVNLLWLECANSLLVGVVFWVKSKTLGPYCRLPENVCSWQIYWHLSKGTPLQQLPIAVLNPSKGKGNTLTHV